MGIFVCSSCGGQSSTWMGRCRSCGEWDTLVEQRLEKKGNGGRSRSKAKALVPELLAEVATQEHLRMHSGLEGFDRVVGSGLVPGSIALIGGPPGIGKSTLLNQVVAGLAGAGKKTLYVSGEESVAQVRMRADRLGGTALNVPAISETDLGQVIATIEAERPAVCVVDSVQVLHSSELVSAAGSVAQVREATTALMEVAKKLDITVLLVGHVTKDGALAGPRVLEHMVDCVLQFEGDRQRAFRVLRATKNRFGSASELAVFEMEEEGLQAVEDASQVFIEQSSGAAGSCLSVTVEGAQPMIIEVQALVSATEIVPPRRVAQGFDRNRLSLILAVLARHCGLGLGGSDVFVSVAGGVQLSDPGADLAVALAIASSVKDYPLTAGSRPPTPLVAFGEIGLTGELRSVAHSDRRLAEAARFGIDKVICPGAKKVGGRIGDGGRVTYESLRQALVAAMSPADAGVVPKMTVN